MKKSVKIAVNILIFLIIAGFVCYMIVCFKNDKSISNDVEKIEKEHFISPYKLVSSFRTTHPLVTFDCYDDKIYMASNNGIFIFDSIGTVVDSFAMENNIRDISVNHDLLYVLYPAKISVFSLSGEKKHEWEACSDHSDYCSLVIASGYVFATDAENKNICQYTVDGNFVRFIKSPNGFIIPSYSFDIIVINDTLYCANSGRHKIESYTLKGVFIADFGKAGGEAGSFAGCCNPAYLTSTPRGDIITSEKGNPRVSCYDKNGNFRTILFNNEMLGGGNKATEVRMVGEEIYVAGNNIISRYHFDPKQASNSACADCPVDCPMKKGFNE